VLLADGIGTGFFGGFQRAEPWPWLAPSTAPRGAAFLYPRVHLLADTSSPTVPSQLRSAARSVFDPARTR